MFAAVPIITLDICRYWAEVSDASREKCTAILVATLAALLRSLKQDGSNTKRGDAGSDDEDLESDGDMSEDEIDASSPTCKRNGFKQLVYLLSECAAMTAKLDADAAAKSDKPQRGKAKTGEASGNKLHVCLEKQLQALAVAADSEFNRLWPLGVPEEVRIM